MDGYAGGNMFECASPWTLLQAIHNTIGCKITGEVKVEIWRFYCISYANRK